MVWPFFVSSISRVWSICLSISATLKIRILLKKEFYLSWPKCGLKQQAHFINTTRKNCILKNKVLFYSALLPPPPIPHLTSSSLTYCMNFLTHRGAHFATKFQTGKLCKHTLPLRLSFDPSYLCRNSCFENERGPDFLGPAQWQKALRLLQFPCS